jgi:uncharacterized membrane protein (DUF106 family)
MWSFNSLFGKIFALLLQPFRSFNPWVGMAVISLITGLLMLLIFKYTSNQKGIRRTKDRIKAHLLEMRLYKDSLSTTLKAQGGILKANLRYMSYSLIPLMVMIVPVLLILIQLNFWFNYSPLQTGESVLLKVTLKPEYNPMEIDLQLQPSPAFVEEVPALRIEEENEIDWRLSFTESGTHSLILLVGDERLEKSVTVGDGRIQRLSPLRVRRNVFQELLYPAEPPLPQDSPVIAIEVIYATQGLDLFGFSIHWLIAFFVLSVIFGFSFKGVFGVDI